MHTYIHIYIYTYIHIYIYTYIHIYIFTYIHIHHIHKCVYIYIHTHIHNVNSRCYHETSLSFDLFDVRVQFVSLTKAPLQPHMVQRAYIASSDANLRIVMAAMLVAPFVAQPPGIVIGLTKSAYNPSFPLVNQDATAFSGLTSQLKMTGQTKKLKDVEKYLLVKQFGYLFTHQDRKS